MTTRVDIPGVGLVDFPDEMSHTDIQQAIETDILKPEPPSIFGRIFGGIDDIRRGMQDDTNEELATSNIYDGLETFGESQANAADAARRADLERGSMAGMEAGFGPVTRRGMAEQQSDPLAPRMTDDQVRAKLADNEAATIRDMTFDAEQPRGVGGIVSDVAVQLGIGVQQIAGSPVSLLAPESDMAKRNAAWSADAFATLSPTTRANIALADQRIKKAAEEGLWEELETVGVEYFTNPVLAQHFVATTLPSMIGVLGPAKAAQAIVAMRGGSAASIRLASLIAASSANATLTGGDARQDAFDDLYATFKKSGMSDNDAKALALSESRLSAGVGLAFGALGGAFGAESNLLGGYARIGSSAVSRAASAIAREIGTELPEELMPLVVKNWQAAAVDNRSLLKDVPATAGQTIIGVGPMAAMGGVGAATRKTLDQTIADEIDLGTFDPSAIDAEVRRRMSPDFAQQQATRVVGPGHGDVMGAQSVEEAISSAQAATGEVIPPEQARSSIELSQQQDAALEQLERARLQDDPLDAAFARGEQLGAQIQNAPTPVQTDPLNAALETGAAVTEEIANAPQMDATSDQGTGAIAGRSAGDTQLGDVVESGVGQSTGTPVSSGGTDTTMGAPVAVADEALTQAPSDVMQVTPHKGLATAWANRARAKNPGMQIEVVQADNGKWEVRGRRTEDAGTSRVESAQPEQQAQQASQQVVAGNVEAQQVAASTSQIAGTEAGSGVVAQDDAGTAPAGARPSQAVAQDQGGSSQEGLTRESYTPDEIASRETAPRESEQSGFDYIQASKVESTAQGALVTAREHKKRAYEQIKRLRQQIKDEPLNGNRSGLRLDLLKATGRHREYMRMETSALEIIEADANRQGKTIIKQKPDRSTPVAVEDEASGSLNEQQPTTPSGASRTTRESRAPARDDDFLTLFDEVDSIAVEAPKMSEQEIDDAETSFLSDFPEGSRYPRKTRLLERIRRESDSASDAIGGNAETARGNARTLGAFSEYETRGQVLESDSFNPKGSLRVEVFGREQVEAGLTDEPALTITVTPDGELTINGPSTSTDTFREFMARGWADRAKGANGEVQPGWAALKDPKNQNKPLPIQQLIPLLADVHARVRAWRGEDYVGLHWSRATGAMGGMAWGGNDATAVFFSRTEGAEYGDESEEGSYPVGVTESSLRYDFMDTFPSLVPSLESMLTRGRDGKKGGLVLIDSNDEREIARVFKIKTGRDLDLDDGGNEAMPSNKGVLQGLYNSDSGLLFLVTPNVDDDVVVSVILHEIVHSQQNARIDAKSLRLLNEHNNPLHSKGTREFLDRVLKRMKFAKFEGTPDEATAYIVEQAVMEGRKAGFSSIDGKFMDWVDATFGRAVGNVIRDFVASVRAWMLRHGVLRTIAIDDLVAIAKAGMVQAGKGDVRTVGDAARRSFAGERATTENEVTKDETAAEDDLNGVTMFSRNYPSRPRNPPAGPAPFSSPTMPDGKVAQTFENIRYQFQDRFIDLKKIQDAIRDSGKTIRDEFNPYDSETRMHGKAAYRVQMFMEKDVDPILAVMRASKIKMDVFENYLHARHAKERNAVMAKINPNRAELDAMIVDAETDLAQANADLQAAIAANAGVQQATNEFRSAQAKARALQNAKPWTGTEKDRQRLSGMSNDEADKILKQIANGPQSALFDRLGKRIDDITSATRQEMAGYGLEPAGYVAAMDGQYKHYVPLMQDLDESDLLGTTSGTGAGFSIRGTMVKKATGSLREVENIFANIVAQREATIVRGEKNVVAKALYGLVLENPSLDLWTVIRPDMSKEVLRRELQAMGLDPATVDAMSESPTAPTINEKTGIVEHRVNPNFSLMPNAIVLRVAGEDRVILLSTTDDRAVRLAGALRNDDTDNRGASGFVMRQVGPVTRYLAAINTQYNPIFGMTNFTRDMQEAMLNLQSTELAGKQMEVIANTGDSLAGIWNWERGDRSHPMAKVYEEFLADGGATGFRDQFANIEDRSKAIKKHLAGKRVVDRQGVKQIAQLLTDYNTAIENSVRLSAYKAARDSGMSRAKAAVLAKDLTVNFNRKGARSGLMASLFAFFNSAAQGIERQLRTLNSPYGKKIIAGGLAFGAAQAAIGILMLGDDWDEIPEFERSKNLILPTPWTDKKYVKIPLPLGYYYIPNMSRTLAEMAWYQDRMGERTVDLLTGTLDAFNPVGSSSALAMVTPTVVDPFSEIATNKGFSGREIYRKDFSSLDPTPGHTRAKQGTSAAFVGLSRLVNAALGGDEDIPSSIYSPTPEEFAHLFGAATGGVGREIAKSAAMVESVVNGDSMPPHKLPLVGRFYGEAGGNSAIRKKYFDSIREVNIAENAAIGRTKRGEELGEVESIAGLVKIGRKFQQRISGLNKSRDQSDNREERKEYETDIVEIQRQFVELVETAKKQTD